MAQLNVVICSTRPGRAGLPIGKWFAERARAHGKFEVALVDLMEMNLPLLDEAAHPMKRQYQHAHTKAWSESVNGADAFVFVTPEYNYGSPPSLVNALDCLYHEWSYKPAGMVSYGGMSGGVRSAQMTKQILTTLKMMPIPEAVAIPFFMKAFDEQKNFAPGDVHDQAIQRMLDELHRWSEALRVLRS